MIITRAIAPKYSVRLVHLQMPKEDWASPNPSQPNTRDRPKPVKKLGVRPSRKAGHAAPAEQVAAAAHKRFLLPPDVRRPVATQTLVQIDVPPDVMLKQEIPLPTALLWTQAIHPLQPVRQFVAPPEAKTPEVAKALPAAPALDSPNRETEVANINVAAAKPTETPHLTHPATITSPVSSPGQEPAREIPQVGLATSTQPSASGLISLSNTPLRPTPVAALPPANQVAAPDRASGGSSLGEGGKSPDGSAAPSRSVTAADAAATPGKVTVATSTGTKTQVPASSVASARTSSGSARPQEPVPAPRREVVSASTGKGGATTPPVDKGPEVGAPGKADGTERAPLVIPGTTRITQPRDGKFGVVVQASADSTRYPEGAGALSGKVVYTVYLRLGMRKNWILQYCLPKSAGKSGSTPVDAPWPFEMLRPDRWGDTESDYVMVKGMLTSGGQFEQLAMVFPDNMETQDLLLASLKGWAFRPASRDGEPTAVEVLLIIPRQTE